jgi:hypothetical protein
VTPAGLTQEEKHEQESRAFSARPLPESTYEPSFVPQPSDREPLLPCENVLHSELRAEK